MVCDLSQLLAPHVRREVIDMYTNPTPPNIWNGIALRALRSVNQISVVEELMTPEKAMHGLEWNFRSNRSPRPGNIKAFVTLLKDESFSPGSQLRIARDESGQWVLVDGQHRLQAIVMSGVSAPMLIVADDRPAKEAYANIDSVGSLRTAGDSVYSELGWKVSYWNSVSGAARIIEKEFKDFSLSGTKISTEEKKRISETLNEYRQEIEWFAENAKRIQAFFRSSTLSVLLVALKYQRSISQSFIANAAADDGLAAGSPEKMLLRSFGVKTKGDNRNTAHADIAYITALIWNAKYEERKLLKMPHCTKWPGIRGTPFKGE